MLKVTSPTFCLDRIFGVDGNEEARGRATEKIVDLEGRWRMRCNKIMLCETNTMH